MNKSFLENNGNQPGGNNPKEPAGKRVDHGLTPEDFRDLHISESDTESALNELHGRLGLPEADHQTQKTSGQRKLWWLAAALILIAIGVGYMHNPVTTIVPHGEQLTLTLNDNSVVELNSGTTISHNRLFGITNRNVSLNGEAFFSVASDDTPFKITSNESKINVLGTSFNVRSWSDDPRSGTEVTVVSGKVEVVANNRQQSRVVLESGESSRFAAGMTEPLFQSKVLVDNILAWRQNNLAFSSQPLYVIFNELERRFDITIEYSDDEIAMSEMTTYYSQLVGPDTILNDIATVKGLTFYETSTGYRIQKQ